MRWDGSATYQRLSAFCSGLVSGMQPVLAGGHPLVLVSDGVTEDHRLKGDRYGHRFTSVVEANAKADARTIGEAILADRRAFSRTEDVADDVTVVVATVADHEPEGQP